MWRVAESRREATRAGAKRPTVWRSCMTGRFLTARKSLRNIGLHRLTVGIEVAILRAR
jgi:hypothetical protein